MNNAMIALEIMGKGMAGIFIAIALIVVTVYILAKITSDNKSEEKPEV